MLFNAARNHAHVHCLAHHQCGRSACQGPTHTVTRAAAGALASTRSRITAGRRQGTHWDEHGTGAPVAACTALASSCVSRSWICSRWLHASSSASSVPGTSCAAAGAVTNSTRASPKNGSMWCSHCEAKRRLATCARQHSDLAVGVCGRSHCRLDGHHATRAACSSTDAGSGHSDKTRSSPACVGSWPGKHRQQRVSKGARACTAPCADGTQDSAAGPRMPSGAQPSAAALLCL